MRNYFSPEKAKKHNIEEEYTVYGYGGRYQLFVTIDLAKGSYLDDRTPMKRLMDVLNEVPVCKLQTFSIDSKRDLLLVVLESL